MWSLYNPIEISILKQENNFVHQKTQDTIDSFTWTGL